MPDFHTIFAIMIAALVTAAIRAGPVFFLARRHFPMILRNWLSFVPVAILSSIITAEVLSNKETTSSGLSVAFLATLTSFVVGLLTRSLFLTVVASIFSYLIFQNM
ncbi:MAG: Azaleucine resistance protein AzlD [Candidatus Tokpelaia sp. JSC161]|nr:MAG: Azaleucine resistance protein AzlD [Candidatus Tokpelaia sp. JSC161]